MKAQSMTIILCWYVLHTLVFIVCASVSVVLDSVVSSSFMVVVSGSARISKNVVNIGRLVPSWNSPPPPPPLQKKISWNPLPKILETSLSNKDMDDTYPTRKCLTHQSVNYATCTCPLIFQKPFQQSILSRI